MTQPFFRSQANLQRRSKKNLREKEETGSFGRPRRKNVCEKALLLKTKKFPEGLFPIPKPQKPEIEKKVGALGMRFKNEVLRSEKNAGVESKRETGGEIYEE